MSADIPPFNKLDRFHLKIKGFDLGYVFQPDGWRLYALLFVIASGVAWVFFGYEGCFDQVEWFGRYYLNFLSGKIPWSNVIEMVQYRYGIGTHLSAAVIYGIMFIAISKYYETINIKGSLNLTMSVLLTVFSIAIFEYSWMASYYVGQQQFWVLTPLTKQASILYQNLLFLTGGIVLLIFVSASPYKFRINKKLGFLLLLSLSIWVFWYWYPLPTKQLTVTLDTGEIWKSYPNFPQTMYTINMNPQNTTGVGTPFFVEDNAVHTVNLVMKMIWSYTIFYFGKLTFRRNHKFNIGRSPKEKEEVLNELE